MAGTTLQDVIVPELLTRTCSTGQWSCSALVQSGIIANNSEFDALASQSAPTVNMPFFEDLTGESEQVIEGTDLEDNKITSNKDVGSNYPSCKDVVRDRFIRSTGRSRSDEGNWYACGTLLGT